MFNKIRAIRDGETEPCHPRQEHLLSSKGQNYLLVILGGAAPSVILNGAVGEVKDLGIAMTCAHGKCLS